MWCYFPSLPSAMFSKATSQTSTMPRLERKHNQCMKNFSNCWAPCTSLRLLKVHMHEIWLSWYSQNSNTLTVPILLKFGWHNSLHCNYIYHTGGEFGAMMQVHIQNDGPVTLQFETPNLPPAKEVWKKIHSIVYSVINLCCLPFSEKAQ